MNLGLVGGWKMYLICMEVSSFAVAEAGNSSLGMEAPAFAGLLASDYNY
jgi:hypothetical protein